MTSTKLSSDQRKELLAVLRARFEKHVSRHGHRAADGG
jgi:hypothetical protein